MPYIEGAPFAGEWTKVNSQNSSCDSIVGIIADQGKSWIIKWARQSACSANMAISMCLFLQKSFRLYLAALGKEFIVPSLFAVGTITVQKFHSLYKPYILQPFVDGYDGRSIPDEVKYNPRVCQQWKLLGERLSVLYSTAYAVNKEHPPGSPLRFPINLTVGSIRRNALDGLGTTHNSNVPKSLNILIRRGDLALQLFDFGAYTCWQNEMEPAYNDILQKFI